MGSISNVSVRFTTYGDVVLDQLISARQNNQSPGVVYLQSFPPGVSTRVHDPFANLTPTGAYLLNGLIVLPPRDNVTLYSITTSITPVGLLFHPTNPAYFPVMQMPLIYLFHSAPKELNFQFFWI
jgi:hypothetical protein